MSCSGNYRSMSGECAHCINATYTTCVDCGAWVCKDCRFGHRGAGKGDKARSATEPRLADPIERVARVASDTDCKYAKTSGVPCPWALCRICENELEERL